MVHKKGISNQSDGTTSFDWQYIGLKETGPMLAPAFHVPAGRDERSGQARSLQPLRDTMAIGMGNEILTDKQDSTKQEVSPVESSPWHPVDDRKKAPLSLKDFGLSKFDTTAQYAVMTKNSTEYHHNDQNEEVKYDLPMALQNKLNRYVEEIAAIQAELESTRADIDLRMGAHNARLQELSRAISSDLRASTLELDSGGARPGPTTPLESQNSNGATGQFRARLSVIDR